MKNAPLQPSECNINNVVALQRAGDFDRAILICRHLTETNGQDVAALTMLGVLLHQKGLPQDGLPFVQRAAQLQPRIASTQLNLGVIAEAARKPDVALAAYHSALYLQPNYPAALSKLAALLKYLNRPDEALVQYKHLVQLAPQSYDGYAGLYWALLRLEKNTEALDLALRTYQRFPNLIEAKLQYAGALMTTLQYDSAQQILDEIDLQFPNNQSATSHPQLAVSQLAAIAACRGVMFFYKKQYARAEQCYLRATALNPLDAGTYGNLIKLLLLDNTRHLEALAKYNDILKIDPTNAMLLYERAHLMVLTGDFTNGFKELEWRWKTPEIRGTWRTYFAPAKLWDGSPLQGKTIFVYWEQGFGDTLNMMRFFPVLISHGATVIIEVQPPLDNLARSIKGVSRVVKAGEHPGRFDYYCATMSLPGLLKISSDNMPGQVPYVHADPSKTVKWKEEIERLAAPTHDHPLKVGVVWKGRPTHKRDTFRSSGLLNLLPMLSMPGIEWISIQKEITDEESQLLKKIGQDNASALPVLNIGPMLSDYQDTAGLIECLDLVISVDTSVAHLTGALGKKIWMMCPLVPDYRWMSSGTSTPWYPTMKIFRQVEENNWDNVIADVMSDLQLLILQNTIGTV